MTVYFFTDTLMFCWSSSLAFLDRVLLQFFLVLVHALLQVIFQIFLDLAMGLDCLKKERDSNNI